jgi:asparagine synthase (glutamine-hydrolysing)
MLAHPLSKMLAWDTQHYLSDDILYKMDRASMFYSIENREPLLDHRIIEFMAQVPPEWKIQQNQLKYMAKSIVHKYIPQAYMDRPKQGFSPPFSQWMRTILRPYLDTYIHETSLQKQGIFVPSFVLERKRKFLAGDNQQERFIRDMLLFQMWYERWM